MKAELIIFSIILCFGFIGVEGKAISQAAPYFLPLFRDHYAEETTTTTTTTPTPFPTTLIYDDKLKTMKRCWIIKKDLLYCKIISREV